MKILVISEKYWPNGGGAELAIHCILKILSRQGFKITVLVGNKVIERLDNVTYIYTPYLDTPYSPKIQLWINLLAQGNRLNTLIKEHDLIYIPRLAYPIIDQARKFDKKIIVHLFDYQPITYDAVIPYPYEEWRKYRTSPIQEMKRILKFQRLNYNIVKAITQSLLCHLNTLSKIWLSHANLIICESHRQFQIITSELPHLKKKVLVIPDPLPEFPFIHKNKKCDLFLYLGGDSFIKGIEIFVNKRLLEFLKSNSIRILLAKVRNQKWKSLFSKLNKKYGNIYEVTDMLTYKQIKTLYSQSRALLFPSHTEEPLPSVILESMLAGTIPIASRSGGTPEIVKDTYAARMLFNPSNIDELIERMEQVLSLNREQLMIIGSTLRDSILRNFNNKKTEKRILKVFS